MAWGGTHGTRRGKCHCKQGAGLTCKALDLWVVYPLSQEVQLLVQALELLPQALQLNSHTCRLIGLQKACLLNMSQLLSNVCQITEGSLLGQRTCWSYMRPLSKPDTGVQVHVASFS